MSDNENNGSATRIAEDAATRIAEETGAAATQVAATQAAGATQVAEVSRSFGGAGDATGAVLGGAYRVTEPMQTASGEADLYLCEDGGGQKYVAKIFRRNDAIKPEVTEKILRLDSPNVARFLADGDYNGYHYVILPYYKNGSLAGRTYSYLQLKTLIIPSIINGLKDLHAVGIFHKDLKPANMMLSDDGKRVVIIDFGVSTVAADGVTSVRTQMNLTPEYSSFEALNGAFTDLSDYYSLGISIYELYCGHTPLRGATPEEIIQYQTLYTFPYPDGMEEDLKELISALVYPDIRFRNEPGNPNCRWGYEQVDKWLKGIKQPLPGEGKAAARDGFRPYDFNGKTYNDLHSLVTALALNWQDGQKQLYRGYISEHLGACGMRGLQTMCDDAIEERGDADMKYFDILYRLDPSLSGIYWKNVRFNTAAEAGAGILSELRNGGDARAFDELMERRIFSRFLNLTAPERGDHIRLAEALEKQYKIADSPRTKRLALYSMGYSLSGDRDFYMDGVRIADPEGLTEYLEKQRSVSFKDFSAACLKLIDERNELDPQLEAWLLCIGKKKELDAWKAKL